MGLMRQARKLGSTTSYGTFKLLQQTPTATDALQNCDRTSDTVFLWLESEQSNVTVTWTPPSDDGGILQFV